MSVIKTVQFEFFRLTVSEEAKDSNSCTIKLTCSRNGTKFWGGSPKTGYGAEFIINGQRYYWWACPQLSKWLYDSNGYYLNSNSGKQYLAYEPWYDGSTSYLGTPLSLSDTCSKTVKINIDKGNNRQGTKSITLGVKGFVSGTTQINISTSSIADPSNVICKCTYNEESKAIDVTYGFTNKENYYTLKLYNGDTLLTSTQTSGQQSTSIPVSSDINKTTQSFTVKIIGKDGKEYATSSDSIYVDTNEIGIWYKDNDTVYPVDEVWYKDAEGIHQVDETWIKRNNSIIKIVK